MSSRADEDNYSLANRNEMSGHTSKTLIEWLKTASDAKKQWKTGSAPGRLRTIRGSQNGGPLDKLSVRRARLGLQSERRRLRRRWQSSRPYRCLLQKRRRSLRATLVMRLGRTATSFQRISRWAE